MRVAPLATSIMLAAFSASCLMAQPARAVPNFARKYNVSCNVCHTREPRLNPFGQQFQENGYQIPGTEDGGTTLKDLFGGRLHAVTLDEITNILSVRMRADLQQANLREETEATEKVDLVFPNIINLFLAGTATENIAYFIEGELDFAAGEHAEGFEFERAMVIFNNLGGYQLANLKIGNFDPSTFFAFPTHRQQLNPIIPDAHTDGFPPHINRVPALPLAFASKMFGMTTGPANAGDEGFSILPFEPFLFNSPSVEGATLYGRPPFAENLLYQVGVVRETTAKDESDIRWDWYALLRYDLLPADYMALQLSAFYYGARDAARPALAGSTPTDPVFATEAVDWKRFGVGVRAHYRFVDIYGTFIWDRIDRPRFAAAPASLSEWDTTALGVSLEADWLINEHWLLAVRYDFMDPGGLKKLPPMLQAGAPRINQDISFLAVIAKFYPRPNIALYARAHFNLIGSSRLPVAVFGGAEHPARNLRSMWTIGLDLAF